MTAFSAGPLGRKLPSKGPTTAPSPRIFFCGDVHGQFDHVIAAVDALRPHAVVFLGDLDPRRPLEEELAPILGSAEVWFIHGNHETDEADTACNLFGSRLADRNLHGRVVDVAGVRIAGLGGVFRRKIWWPPEAPAFQRYEDYIRFTQVMRRRSKADHGEDAPGRGGGCLTEDRPESREQRRHRSSIFPDVYERLAAMSADVLVTHEAPSCHPYGHASLDELGRCLGVRWAFHGHHHDRLDYSAMTDRLGFRAFGVGLRGIASLDGEVIVEGEDDNYRR